MSTGPANAGVAVAPGDRLRRGRDGADEAPVTGEGGDAPHDGKASTLWREYRAEPTRDRRDHLVYHYAGLVKVVVGRVASKLPRHVAPEDLTTHALIGLVSAIERYDAEMGRFEPYALLRMRGAVIDGLRQEDLAPRSVRRVAVDIAATEQRLATELQRAPTEAEIAAELGMTVRKLQDNLVKISRTNIVSLDDALTSPTGVPRHAGLRSAADGPGEWLEATATKEALADGLRLLPERERKVLLLYYYEELTMAEIGRIMQVTESRICQIHARGVLNLKAQMAA